MSTSTVDALVEEYLRRLRTAAAGLPPDRRGELLEEIEGHIAGARAAGAAADEAAVRTLLDRLGPPEVIAAAAADDAGPTAPVALAPPGTGLELAAVLLLTAGSFVPVVGWLAGVALLWSSRRWTVGDKLLGTLVVPLGPGGVLLLGALLPFGSTCTTSSVVTAVPGAGGVVDEAPAVVTETCSGVALPAWAGVPLLLLALAAPAVVAVVLHRRAAARAALEPPRPVRPSPWGGLEVAAVVVLALGSFVVPVVGTVVGLVLVWCSGRWSRRQKGVATALAVLPASLFLLLPLGGVLVTRWPL
jgi:hypothetical protein